MERRVLKQQELVLVPCGVYLAHSVRHDGDSAQDRDNDLFCEHLSVQDFDLFSQLHQLVADELFCKVPGLFVSFLVRVFILFERSRFGLLVWHSEL